MKNLLVKWVPGASAPYRNSGLIQIENDGRGFIFVSLAFDYHSIFFDEVPKDTFHDSPGGNSGPITNDIIDIDDIYFFLIHLILKMRDIFRRIWFSPGDG